jgi:hypothetical protein
MRVHKNTIFILYLRECIALSFLENILRNKLSTCIKKVQKEILKKLEDSF